MKPRAYIAGPMTGIPYLNFRAFDEAEELGRSLGWDIINPATISRENGIDPNHFPTGEEPCPPGYLDEAIELDCKAILSLKSTNGDAIACLPGWELSTGAPREKALGEWKRLAILDATTFLPLHKPWLIGLCGYAKSGKDTIQSALRFHRIAFADALKADIDPVVDRFRGMPKEVKRPVYVEYGLAARKYKSDYWIQRMPAIPRDRNVCITDVRYLNEARWIQDDLGGAVLRVVRAGVGPANDEERDSIMEIDNAMPWLPAVYNNKDPRWAAMQVLERLRRRQTAQDEGVVRHVSALAAA